MAEMEQTTTPTGIGPCEECKANRRRLISLAADVMGFRRTVERLDAVDVQQLAIRLNGVEMLLWGVVGYMAVTAVLEIRDRARG